MKLPVGESDFQKLRQKGAYFVDKSLFIKELLDHWSDILLITRPRRFGKTLLLTMLRYFFEKSDEDRTSLFEGLKIYDTPEFREHFGKYPVIFLTFKDVK